MLAFAVLALLVALSVLLTRWRIANYRRFTERRF